MSDARVILVAGATGALGPDVVARLVAAGHRVVITGRNEEKLAKLAAEYGEEAVFPVVTDMADPLLAGRAVGDVVERFGHVDGLVNLIGDFAVGPVMLTDLAAYRRLFETNVLAAITATKAVLPQLGEKSHLVYISSVLASEPFPGFAGYAASKAALQAWVRGLSHEVKHRGVHANIVVMTMADTPEARRQRPHADFEQATKPDSVAKVVDFLLSPAADGLYGATIPVLGKFEFSTALAAPPPGAPPIGRL
ncbi:oxidoreductase [Actinoplanes sp. NBRC 14428]|uniref:NADP-dependent 3-hydroxy acid dehydrogenase YdfG n=1 Tax=Pseudosporangium ferrugineum TaxID=439699 RepID=A0A2T0RXN6_9ACTN|nr:SDR family oxidoreductase [Pseudosporangium ferrugineum]PRY25803.1 NADP-dependent 3-hydroxy acid dehydrogenase YdfG [Pseudosporangium ferrugineum]BCJ56147.1 oxidoreductase [Actinoplanes sp. NBRC 14428]